MSYILDLKVVYMTNCPRNSLTGEMVWTVTLCVKILILAPNITHIREEKHFKVQYNAQICCRHWTEE